MTCHYSLVKKPDASNIDLNNNLKKMNFNPNLTRKTRTDFFLAKYK